MLCAVISRIRGLGAGTEMIVNFMRGSFIPQRGRAGNIESRFDAPE